jgi:hypothetical protein
VAQDTRHAADLPLAALLQHNAQPRAISFLTEQRNASWRGPSPIQEDAPAPVKKRGVAGMAFHAHVVLPLVSVAWVGKSIGEVAVVGEQHQPFAPKVKPPHGEEMPRQRHQVAHRTPATVVFRHRKHPARFVDSDVDVILRNAHRPSIYGDRIACRVSFLPKLCDLTPNPYPPATNQVLA